MPETLKIRPLTLPERMLDELYFLAKRRRLSPQALVVSVLEGYLNSIEAQELSKLFEVGGPSVQLFAKLPSKLDEALETKSSQLGRSPNFIIYQALAREIGSNRSPQGV
ncbi:MAG: hypothetical protein WC028_05510 [Candidatus Obscuribacterales bacterium]